MADSLLPDDDSNLDALSIYSSDYSNIPTKTFELDLRKKKLTGNMTDGRGALEQAIYLILNIERYKWLIESWNYGHELSGLYGRPLTLVIPEAQRLITEAITADGRFDSVSDFVFKNGNRRGALMVSFTVATNISDIGDISINDYQIEG